MPLGLNIWYHWWVLNFYNQKIIFKSFRNLAKSCLVLGLVFWSVWNMVLLGKTVLRGLSCVQMEFLGDLWIGPAQVTLKMWEVCILRLVSWLDILHKQEFERGEKKHYFKYLLAYSCQVSRKKKACVYMHLGGAVWISSAWGLLSVWLIDRCFSCNVGEGHVFVWGYGILGKGPNLVETALPEMIPPTLFGLTEFNPEVQVSRIRCGLSHFAALTSKWPSRVAPETDRASLSHIQPRLWAALSFHPSSGVVPLCG